MANDRMPKFYDGETFEIPEAPGHLFRVHIERDDNSSDPPWERCEGHGPVRYERTGYAGRPIKRPGERLLRSDMHGGWLYDWQAACKMAREDGWNAEPYDAPNRIERAVQADFDFLRRWLNDDWHYVGVCVELLDEDGDPATEKYANALWGIESCAEDYIAETALELARECAISEGVTLEQRSQVWREALHEARERRYWAARDVATI